MESYLNKNTKKSLDELIKYIKNTFEYKECIRLKKEMNFDKELMELIEEVKILQKKYVRNNFNDEEKNILEKKMILLKNNKLYNIYVYYLDKVNNMIDIVKDELNDYFYNVVNVLKY